MEQPMSILSNEPISRRVSVGLGALGVCIALVAGAAFYSMTEVSNAKEGWGSQGAWGNHEKPGGFHHRNIMGKRWVICGDLSSQNAGFP